MRRWFDRIDLLAALGLFAGVAAWAFLWAHPYPHPDLWPFLVAAQGKVGMGTLGVAGRLALGAFAAFTYLVMRGFWLRHRSKEDELPDKFLCARLAPICGAATFVLLPYTWRAGQFLSPGFALLVLTFFGLFLWICGRGGRGFLTYSLAYFVFGFVGGLNLFGLVTLVYAVAADVILRWICGQAHGQREDDTTAAKRRSLEAWLSFFATVIGFVFGVHLLISLVLDRDVAFNLLVRFSAWRTGWTYGAVRSMLSPAMLALALSITAAAAGLAIGKRLRSLGSSGRFMCRVLAGVLSLTTLMMLFRSVDYEERLRLQAFREYAAQVANDTRDVRFLFTDGRFDDAFRLEFAAREADTTVLNVMIPPTPEEAVHLKTLAPEPGDRAIFEAGGAEVFKAWARERPDRLAESAWQLGGGIVRRHGKVTQRTHGSVMRCADAAKTERDDDADVRFGEWSERLKEIAEREPVCGSLFGGTDDAVAAHFDVLLWRAARLAGERKDTQLMHQLDGVNASLRAQGEIVERMLPTEKLVLTARESLDVALKRADFMLARRYAGEILAGTPDDSAAHFALGMANLEAKEYFKASVCFEKALAKNPDEPAALNNLAIAYMKMGEGEKALSFAERAAKVHPKSKEIQRTLAEIRKNVLKK